MNTPTLKALALLEKTAATPTQLVSAIGRDPTRFARILKTTAKNPAMKQLAKRIDTSAVSGFSGPTIAAALQRQASALSQKGTTLVKGRVERLAHMPKYTFVA